MVRDLLMKDFREDDSTDGGGAAPGELGIEELSLKANQRICYEIIQDIGGFAKFVEQCCGKEGPVYS